MPPLPFDNPIYVTRPILPLLENYVSALDGIWQRQWLTNEGKMVVALERALCNRLRVSHLSVTNNGTTAISLACAALGLVGEVITTPFTFPATPNALRWIGLTPIFADIDPITLTLDPNAVKRAITGRTTAILGVHVYGIPCHTAALQDIAEKHGLHLIYDGAHAFGTEIDGEPIPNFGAATTLSFHATKIFNTAEGGAVVTRDSALKQRIDLLKNLGIKNELTVTLPGINGRMNELQAALGLANLEVLAREYDGRGTIAEIYRTRLKTLAGLTFVELPPGVRASHQYFVIRIDSNVAPLSRDDLCERLKEYNLFARRYFYPLCSEIPAYRELASSRPGNLTVAHRISKEVLCLPFYGTLAPAVAHRICDIIEYECVRKT
jgi:dTDP-4-amino-4,6-dideoxygalactose transaminase